MSQEKEYFAFISYKREDEKWAKWLQHKLEHYKLPSNVRKGNPSLPRDLCPVFMDTSELVSGVLADEIRSALEQSQYLIVICSPRAAQSDWVCKEGPIVYRHGKDERDNTLHCGWKSFPPLQQFIDETRKRFKDCKLTSEERRKYDLE